MVDGAIGGSDGVNEAWASGNLGGRFGGGGGIGEACGAGAGGESGRTRGRGGGGGGVALGAGSVGFTGDVAFGSGGSKTTSFHRQNQTEA